MMNKILFKKIMLLLLTAGMVIASSACARKNKVNIACFANITHSQALYSMSVGDIIGGEEPGWYLFNAGPSEMEAIRSGAIDVGYIGPVPAITGYVNTNGGIKIIAASANAGSMLVAGKGSGINDINDLKGKTVAVPQFGNTQDIILRMLLNDAGLSSTENGGDVEIIQQANANIKQLMETGDIDAALVPEPWGTRLKKESGANVLLSGDDILGGDYPVTVVIVRTEFLEENRETVKEFLKCHIANTEKSNRDDSDVSSTVNQAIAMLTGIKLGEDVLMEAYSEIKFDYRLNIDALNSFIDICKEQGLIPQESDLSGLVDLSLLEEILNENKESLCLK